MSASLDELLSALVDEDLTQAAADELAERLAADAAARRRYLQAVELHALLHWHGGRIPTAAPPRRRARNAVRIAAAVLLVAAPILGWWILRDATTPARTTAARVATLARELGATWRDGRSPHDGLAAGDVLELRSGVAELRIGDAGTLLLEAPAVVELRGTAAVHLHHGRATANAGRLPLTVTTAQGSVRGGGEFGVEAGPDIAQVHAFDAPVELSGSGGAESLAPRQSVAMTLGAPAQRLAAHESPPFLRALPAAGHRDVRFVPDAAIWNGGFEAHGSWHDAASWSTGRVPEPTMSAWVSRGATIVIPRDATAGELAIGIAHLRVDGGTTTISGRSGSIDLGFGGRRATLEVNGGALQLDARIVLRENADLRMSAGTLIVGSEILFLEPNARWRLVTGTHTRARGVLGLGPGTTTTVVIEGAARAPLVAVAMPIVVGGRLAVELPLGQATPRQDVVLLASSSGTKPAGRFERLDEGAVVHAWADGASLRISYSHSADGGPADDVALVHHAPH